RGVSSFFMAIGYLICKKFTKNYKSDFVVIQGMPIIKESRIWFRADPLSTVEKIRFSDAQTLRDIAFYKGEELTLGSDGNMTTLNGRPIFDIRTILQEGLPEGHKVLRYDSLRKYRTYRLTHDEIFMNQRWPTDYIVSLLKTSDQPDRAAIEI